MGEDAPGWIADALSEPSGIFDPKLVAQLWAKCRARQDQFSNADNMALVGVLSTQLLYQQFVRAWPQGKDVALTTLVDRLEGPRAPSV